MAVKPLALDAEAPAPSGAALAGVQERPGTRWVRVKIRIKAGDDPVELSRVGYQLADRTGDRYHAVPKPVYQPGVTCCGSDEGQGRLPSGETREGFIAFQVPTAADPATLRAFPRPRGRRKPVMWALR